MDAKKARLFRELVSGMSVQDLQELNKMVVGEFRDVQRREGARESLKYDVGQTVKFRGKHGKILEGVIEKINGKTLSIMVGGFQRWRVSYTYVVG